MPSNDFSAFTESYFGDPYMAWHDGLDTEALLRLQGDEQAEAERLLIAGLATGDYRPAAGLAILRSQQSAPQLKALLPGTSGDTRVQTALALWQIERYAPAVPALIDVLRHAPFWGQRINAAIALGKVSTPESVTALLTALTDREALVRSHAADALFALHGLTDRDPPNDLSIAIMSDDAKERAAARTAIKRMIAPPGKLQMDDGP